MGFAPTSMKVTSSSFGTHKPIPTKHTGEGVDVSPPLAWVDPPDGTKGYAVICHDPDAPLCKPGGYGFVHWVLYNIPGSVTSLPEGGGGAFTNGVTDFDQSGYGGPMPPEGHGTHHYYFWVFALDTETDLEPGLTMEALLEKIEPHVIGMNRLIGTYRRD
jgi:Raf kinase inhibitor-like YbhB/YbcL family protein